LFLERSHQTRNPRAASRESPTATAIAAMAPVEKPLCDAVGGEALEDVEAVEDAAPKVTVLGGIVEDDDVGIAAAAPLRSPSFHLTCKGSAMR